jgi:hypothetical protein
MQRIVPVVFYCPDEWNTKYPGKWLLIGNAEYDEYDNITDDVLPFVGDGKKDMLAATDWKRYANAVELRGNPLPQTHGRSSTFMRSSVLAPKV